MTVRWESVVVDCRDPRAQAAWWGETLGWPVVYDEEDEAGIAPPFVAEHTRDTPPIERWPEMTFVPVPDGKTIKNRLHIDLAPGIDDSQEAEVAALVARGARLADVGQGDDVTWVVLEDPEGNEFCVLSPRV